MCFSGMSETLAPLIWKLAAWGQRLPLPTGRLREPTGSSSMVLHTQITIQGVQQEKVEYGRKEASYLKRNWVKLKRTCFYISLLAEIVIAKAVSCYSPWNFCSWKCHLLTEHQAPNGSQRFSSPIQSLFLMFKTQNIMTGYSINLKTRCNLSHQLQLQHNSFHILTFN